MFDREKIDKKNITNDFYHCVITIMNVKAKKNVDWPKSSEWLSHRLDLFEKYCYPSVLGQTIKNFEWLVFFHKDSIDEDNMKRILNYEFLTPVFISGTKYFTKYNIINYLIKTKKLSKKKYLITTNTDSDDAIHKNYIKDIQAKHFKQQDFEIINFSLGYRYFIEDRTPWLFNWWGNSLFTMIEKIPSNPKNLKTSRYVYSHAEICRVLFRKNVKNIVTDPMFFQVIHDSNIQTMYREGDRWRSLVKGPKNKKVNLTKQEIKEKFNIDINFEENL